MSIITIRVRSLAWLVTGGLLATTFLFMFANAWRADAAPGDSDTTFVPITPCRLEDTRETHFLNGPATTGFQGTGPVGKCNVPSEAVALQMNVTAINPEKLSFLTFWADGPRPDAASLNPAPGQPPSPNAVVVPLTSTGAFSVYNASGAVDITIDVNGYYTKSSLATLAKATGGIDAKIPSGVTVKGDFHFEQAYQFLEARNESIIHLPARAPVALTDDTVNFKADPADPVIDDDPTCTGTAAAPTAPAGKVCIYPSFTSGVGFINAGVGAGTVGEIVFKDQSFLINWSNLDDFDPASFYGTWAYTAP